MHLQTTHMSFAELILYLYSKVHYTFESNIFYIRMHVLENDILCVMFKRDTITFQTYSHFRSNFNDSFIKQS